MSSRGHQLSGCGKSGRWSCDETDDGNEDYDIRIVYGFCVTSGAVFVAIGTGAADAVFVAGVHGASVRFSHFLLCSNLSERSEVTTEAERFLGLGCDGQGADGARSGNVVHGRKPVCNILALVLPPLSFGVECLIFSCFDTSEWREFGLIIVLGLFFLAIIVPLSLVLAIVSLFRGERYVPLTIVELVVYGGFVFCMIGVAVK